MESPRHCTHRPAGKGDAHAQTGIALLRVFFQTGFSGIELIILAHFLRRDLRHDDIGAELQAFLAPDGIERLQGGGRGDIDVAQREARGGDHQQAEAYALSDVGAAFVSQRRCGMGNERAHADHVDIVLLVEQDVVGKVLRCLSGQADHHAGADLIADLPQQGEALQTRFKCLIAGSILANRAGLVDSIRSR